MRTESCFAAANVDASSARQPLDSFGTCATTPPASAHNLQGLSDAMSSIGPRSTADRIDSSVGVRNVEGRAIQAARFGTYSSCLKGRPAPSSSSNSGRIASDVGTPLAH